MKSGLTQVKMTFQQENDCCDNENYGQYLEIETHDGGGGIFYTIKTERWAFNDFEELINTLKDFSNRIEGIVDE